MQGNNLVILGFFLYKAIRTGGHRRYLELMDDLGARGHTVYLLINPTLEYKFTHVKSIPLPVQYTHGQKYPVSWVFKACVQKHLPTILSQIQNPDWLLIFSETNLAAASFLKKRLSCKLLYGHRSNMVQEAEIFFQESRGRPLKQLKYSFDACKFKAYERRIAKIADAIVFQSAYDRSDFLTRNPQAEKKSHSIGGHIGPPRFDTENALINASTDVKRLLFVGTTGLRKGLKYLLMALAILKEQGIDSLVLDVLGPGETNEHTAFLRAHGLLEYVRFHGRISNPFTFFRSCDLMVAPSLFDSYPDTVLEALHTGIPVLASSVGGIPEMLGEPDLLFPPCDAKTLADTLSKTYRSTEHYQHLRNLCRKRLALFQFDWGERWSNIMIKDAVEEQSPRG